MALRELRIGNIAVIADATATFGDSFTTITGETGAGKSLCVAALRAALGGKLDADMVRHGAEGARVAAVFDEIPTAVRERIDDMGVPPGHDVLTLSRELGRGAKSACRINGALVSQAVLREVGETLVEVTSQGASQRLLRGSWQRDTLDAAGGEGTTGARQRTEAAVRAWRDAEDALAEARRVAMNDSGLVERSRDVVAELRPLALRHGEDDELGAECLRLRHAARIAAVAQGLAHAASGEDGGVADALASATAQAEQLTAVDPALRGIADEAADLVARLRELGLDARRHADSVSLDEARLAAVEERLEILSRMARRYGSVDGALAALEAADGIVAGADGGEDMLNELEAAATAARAAASEAAAALSRLRSDAARRLEREVVDVLRGLELPKARFRVTLARLPDPNGIDVGDGALVRCGRSGVDEVEFRFAAGRDALPRPLHDGPSGGELSRLALALASVVGDGAAPGLVLDEVDTGLGGETAARVGDVLAAIGSSRQVIAITHRPEIAARADTHIVVSKRELAGGPAATIVRVSGEERLVEVARLMSGRTTKAALARAAELLREGQRERGSGHRPEAALRTM